MAGISVTDVYDSLLTSTLRNYRNKLVNNIFEKLRTLAWLMRKRGNGKEIGTFDLQDGGYEIVEQLMYGKNTTFKFYSGYETLETTPQEGQTIAKYPWCELGGTISISRKEKRQNSGKHQLLNLWKGKVKQAELSARDKFSENLFANISAEPAKDINSLLLIASNSPSTTTVGSVSGATYSWWRNYQVDVGAYAANLEDKMRTGFNTVGKWGEVDGIVATQNAYEYYESLGVTLKRFVVTRNEKATLDLGFEVLQYKGADIWFDYDFAEDTPVTGAAMILLNSEHIRLVMDKETNFITTDTIEPENQTAYVAKILAMANVVIDNRAAFGLLHGIDAS